MTRVAERGSENGVQTPPDPLLLCPWRSGSQGAERPALGRNQEEAPKPPEEALNE